MEFEEDKHPRDNDGKFTSGGGESHSEFMEGLRKEEKERFQNRRMLESQVDAVLNGSYKDRHITIAEKTPKIFQDIGVPNKPMLMTRKHTYLAINESGKYIGKDDHYHNLGKKNFLNLPGLLESPILAFQSNDNKDDIISVVNAIDKKGRPIIIPIRINGKGNKDYIEIEANILKSAYGRNNINDYLEQNMTEDNLLLVENKKIRNLHK